MHFGGIGWYYCRDLGSNPEFRWISSAEGVFPFPPQQRQAVVLYCYYAPSWKFWKSDRAFFVFLSEDTTLPTGEILVSFNNQRFTLQRASANVRTMDFSPDGPVYDVHVIELTAPDTIRYLIDKMSERDRIRWDYHHEETLERYPGYHSVGTATFSEAMRLLRPHCSQIHELSKYP